MVQKALLCLMILAHQWAIKAIIGFILLTHLTVGIREEKTFNSHTTQVHIKKTFHILKCPRFLSRSAWCTGSLAVLIHEMKYQVATSNAKISPICCQAVWTRKCSFAKCEPATRFSRILTVAHQRCTYAQNSAFPPARKTWWLYVSGASLLMQAPDECSCGTGGQNRLVVLEDKISEKG